MLLLVTWTFSLVLWIVMWSLGTKAFDAFMLVIVIMVTAAIVHIALPHLPGNKTDKVDGPRPKA
jgi:hypothetical protein